MTNKERHEFKEKVLELRMQYYSTEKIAELLHSNSDTVMLYIKILISEGKLDESYMNLKKKDAEETDEIILKLIHANRNISEIADTLGVTIDTLYKYFDRLIWARKITSKDVASCADVELENSVLELRQKGYTKEQIMSELHIGPRTAREVLEKLISEGRAGKLKGRTAIEIKRKIIPLANDGCTVEEIKVKLKVKEQSIEDYISELIHDGKIDKEEMLRKRREKRDIRKQEVKQLIKEGMLKRDISEKLDIPYKDLNDIIEEIIHDRKKIKFVGAERKSIAYKRNSLADEMEQELDADNLPESGDRNKRIIDDCRTIIAIYCVEIAKSSTSPFVRTQYFSKCKELVNNGGKLKNEEIDGLSEIIKYKNRKLNTEELRFACIEYCKLGNWKSAIQLITSCMEVYGESKELSELRMTILALQKRQEAKNMIKQGMPVSAIMYRTGRSETEILRMKRMYKAEKNNKPEVEESK